MARVTGFWKKVGDTIQPVFTSGVNILVRGADKYINFNSLTGESGYGIRDNNGTLQFKNDAGGWTNFGSGGGGGDMAAAVYDPANGARQVAFADEVFSGDYADLANKPTLGTAAAAATTDFATAAQGAKADTATQPADIANFETTTQLNTRDTANRDRANHTGTQAASTITGLATVATSGDYNDLTNQPDLTAFDNLSVHANEAAFPVTGSLDKLYLTEDTGELFRWTGSAYVGVSTDHAPVTLDGTPNYLTIVGQTITRGLINLTSHVTGLLPFANLADGTSMSVLGRAANSNGVQAPIAASTDHHILRRSGTSIGFGAINLAQANATTGSLPVNKGGTGAATHTSGNYLKGAGTSAITSVTAATLKTELALDQVNNTTDLNKPISTATQTALDLKANLASPTFTGTTAVDRLNYNRAVGTVSALGNLGATETFNWSTATHFTGNLDANITVDFSNAVSGQSITVYYTYSGAARTMAYTPTVVWLDNDAGVAPTPPQASGNVLVATYQYVDTTYYASATGNYAVYS